MTFTKDIQRLCHEVNQEKDGDKLLALVDQLNKELDGISKAPAAGGVAEQQPSDSTRHPEKNPNAA